MKRIYAAVFIITFIISLCIFSSIFIDSFTTQMNEMLDAVTQASLMQDYSALHQNIAALEGYYNKSKPLLFLFLRHDYVYNTSIAISTIQPYSVLGSERDLATEVARAKAQI
ncbi:MAG: DUF4363 family protein, partial [Oscillospiraceae bacterium]|nr:DUF4363 family protein [Oscillospiraceae bacterium]